MTTTSAIFLGLPLRHKRVWKSRMVRLWRVAVTVGHVENGAHEGAPAQLLVAERPYPGAMLVSRRGSRCTTGIPALEVIEHLVHVVRCPGCGNCTGWLCRRTRSRPSASRTERLRAQTLAIPVAGMVKTSLRVTGETLWLHVICDDHFTFYCLRPAVSSGPSTGV